MNLKWHAAASVAGMMLSAASMFCATSGDTMMAWTFASLGLGIMLLFNYPGRPGCGPWHPEHWKAK